MKIYQYPVLLRMVRSSFEGLNYQVRYKSMLNKPPTINATPDPFEIEDKPQKSHGSSKAMQMYLQRVKAYNDFMATERLVFDIGKRHLANMMGRDFETFTQKDVDESIKYLFPSSLYERDARPMMKPPEEIFPAKKEAEFDETGRPFHFLFYTTKPNYYQILHDSCKMLKELNDLEDNVIRGNEINAEFSPVPMETFTWITKENLEKNCNEILTDVEYENFKSTAESIATHPYGSKFLNFLQQFCFEHDEKGVKFSIRKPEVLDDGRQLFRMTNIKRKSIVVNVSVIYPGDGKFLIDGKDIRFFGNVQSRSSVLFPLVLSNMFKKVDVEAEIVNMVESGGETSLALAIRVGIARGVYHFVDDFTKDKLKLAGLLNKEIKTKERKKAGQEGARRKFTWKKR